MDKKRSWKERTVGSEKFLFSFFPNLFFPLHCLSSSFLFPLPSISSSPFPLKRNSALSLFQNFLLLYLLSLLFLHVLGNKWNQFIFLFFVNDDFVSPLNCSSLSLKQENCCFLPPKFNNKTLAIFFTMQKASNTPSKNIHSLFKNITKTNSILFFVSFFLFLWFCKSDWTCVKGITLFLWESVFIFPKLALFILSIILCFFSMSTFDIEITFNFGYHSKMFINCHCHLNDRTTKTKMTN